MLLAAAMFVIAFSAVQLFSPIVQSSAEARQQQGAMTPGAVPAPPDQQEAVAPDQSSSRPSGQGQTRLDPSDRTSASTAPTRECEGCKLLRARVLAADNNGGLIVKDRSKQEIHLKVTRETIMGTENSRYGGFTEGEVVEAYVQPDGIVHSITVVKHPGGLPGADEPGD